MSIALVGAGKPDAQLPLALVTGAGKTLVGAIEGDSVPQAFIPQLISMFEPDAALVAARPTRNHVRGGKGL